MLVALPCAVVFSVIAWGWGEMAFRVWVLNHHGRAAVAEVTAVTRGRQGGWNIGYRFRAGEGPRWYTHTEVVTRGESKTYVSEEQAKASEQTRTVNVVYWPRDPRVNRPQGAAPIETGLLCPGAGVAVMGGVALFSWLYLLDRLLNRLRAGARPVASPDDPVPKTG